MNRSEATFPRVALGVLSLIATGAACAAGESGSKSDPPEAASVEPPPSPPLSERPACGCSEDGRRVLSCDGATASLCKAEETCDGAVCVPSLCADSKTKESSQGCVFDTVVPDAWEGIQGCYAVLLTNTTPRPATLRLRVDGQDVDGARFAYVPKETADGIVYEALPAGVIPPSGLALAFVAGPRSLVSGGEGIGALRQCPAEPAMKVERSSPRSSGFFPVLTLTTSEPVVAADVYPFGGADSYITGAATLLPRSAAGTEYVVAVPAGGGSPVTNAWIDLIGVEPDTTVIVRAGKRGLPGAGTLPPLGPGESMRLPLRAGEVFHLVERIDVTGVFLSSDKPFSALAGSRGWGFPADADHEPLSAVQSLGSEYAAVGHRDRIAGDREMHAFRIVAAVDGTVLTYLPDKPAGAPDALNAAEDALVESENPFIVRSQDGGHPIFVGEYMSSCATNPHYGENGCPGDPEFMGVVAPAQYGNEYLFFTDPTYPTTHLVVTREKGKDGAFADVELDCAGVLAGWAPLGDRYEYLRLDLVTDGHSQNGCKNGRRAMKSEGKFGVNVWGWGRDRVLPDGSFVNETGATSYAFPAGVGLRRLNDVTVVK